MNNTSTMNTSFNKSLVSSAVNSTLKNKSVWARIPVPSKAEGIALCSAFALTSVFIVVGNLLRIILFAVNGRLRKKSLYLVINMAFADLILGALSLPLYLVTSFGRHFQLWTDPMKTFVFSIMSYMIFDNTFLQASLISAVSISCERLYAIYWPFKHRTLSKRTYHIVIGTVWTLALLISLLWAGLTYLISYKHAVLVWVPYSLLQMLIICGCNIAVWRKHQQGSVAPQQQNRAAQNRRLTKTLLFVSVLSLPSLLHLVIMNLLINVFNVSISWQIYFMATVLNYFNSFVNPVVYTLRIPEFRQALGLCCVRRQATRNLENERTNKTVSGLTPVTELRRLQTDPGHLYLPFELENMDTRL